MFLAVGTSPQVSPANRLCDLAIFRGRIGEVLPALVDTSRRHRSRHENKIDHPLQFRK